MRVQLPSRSPPRRTAGLGRAGLLPDIIGRDGSRSCQSDSGKRLSRRGPARLWPSRPTWLSLQSDKRALNASEDTARTAWWQRNSLWPPRNGMATSAKTQASGYSFPSRAALLSPRSNPYHLMKSMNKSVNSRGAASGMPRKIDDLKLGTMPDDRADPFILHRQA